MGVWNLLHLKGNEEFDRKKGKGYGEALILEYALEHSLFVHQCDFLVKITGRLKLLNVNSMIGFIGISFPSL